MDLQSYCGWTNHATWLVNLWLSNDEYTESGLRLAVRYGGHEGLKDYVNELLDDSGIANGTMWYEMIRSCLDDVDWREIASCYQEDEDDTDDGGKE